MPENVAVSRHPLVALKVSELRRAGIGAREVRELTDALGRLLMYEATQDMELTTGGEEQSPVGPFVGRALAQRQALVPILRSGLGLLGAATDLLPDAQVHHLGLFREEATLQPVEYYNKLPRECAVHECFILDPMIATGGTADAAIEILRAWGAPRIVYVAVCASRAGLARVAARHPDVRFVVAVVDNDLSTRGLVVPGIGDCGDRLNNTAA
ncbi:hypothetical protein H4R18_001441 [Coemansia javaensis]|uniref:uracil phosphoribosyltransferase n=1 Tax=Coemansia javaensis TaxID=2761396 RepID=A0A9W8LKL5_9FUNG|nr:hypothetical protein H4R18_001441 [Coemansia javaensis]